MFDATDPSQEPSSHWTKIESGEIIPPELVLISRNNMSREKAGLASYSKQASDGYLGSIKFRSFYTFPTASAKEDLAWLTKIHDDRADSAVNKAYLPDKKKLAWKLWMAARGARAATWMSEWNRSGDEGNSEVSINETNGAVSIRFVREAAFPYSHWEAPFEDFSELYLVNLVEEGCGTDLKSKVFNYTADVYGKMRR